MRLLILFLFATLPQHKFYVSLSEIDYNRDSATLEVALKVFIDDLEKALKVNYQAEFLYEDPNDAPLVDSLTTLYLDQKLKFTADGKKLQNQFLGREYEDDAVWLYIEIPCPKPERQITVQNLVFFDLFDEQKNIMHFKILDKEESYISRLGSGEMIEFNW